VAVTFQSCPTFADTRRSTGTKAKRRQRQARKTTSRSSAISPHPISKPSYDLSHCTTSSIEYGLLILIIRCTLFRSPATEDLTVPPHTRTCTHHPHTSGVTPTWEPTISSSGNGCSHVLCPALTWVSPCLRGHSTNSHTTVPNTIATEEMSMNPRVRHSPTLGRHGLI
jgi:hypothetical protein